MKILEVVAMVMGAYGVLTLNWSWILAMVALMGLQSTFFGPALNGAIPELYPSWYVTRANAVLKLVTTLAILLGMAIAGIALDQHWFETEIPFGRVLVAMVVLVVAVMGVVASFGIKQTYHIPCKTSIPWSGPIASLRDSVNLRHDPPLLLAVLGDTFFYFFSLIAVMLINTMGISELNMSTTATSLLAVALMVGVCLGALIAARITTPQRWSHVLGPASFGMGICLCLAGVIANQDISLQWVLLLLSLSCAGVCGGIFLIPFTAFIQVRPAESEKGKIIAAANFCAFSGMLIAGQVFTLFDAAFVPSSNMVFLGALGIVVSFFFSVGARVARRYESRIDSGGEAI